MSNAAVKIDTVETLPALTLVQGALVHDGAEATQGIKRDILVLATILAVIQILDGVLTTLGVNTFGTHAEGNVLLRTLMHLIGHVPALIVAKSAAIGIIAMLVVLSKQIHWVSFAFKVVIGIYLCAAIVPWSLILLNHA